MVKARGFGPRIRWFESNHPCFPSSLMVMEFNATIETTPETSNEILKQTDSHEYTLKYTKYVQARRHHKKRINKKWLKRYGYKEKTIVIDGLKNYKYRKKWR